MNRLALATLATASLMALFALAACDDELSRPSTEGVTPEAHEAFFPIVTGFHSVVEGDAPLTCTDCHQEGSESFKDFACIDCHTGEHDKGLMDSTHQGFDDYLYESPRCFACHPRGNVLEEIDHDRYFPIRDDDAHGGVACATCHTDADDRSRVSCTACHVGDEIEHGVVEMADVHNGIGEYKWDSPSCVTCHPGAEPVGLMDHTAFFPIGEGDVHGDQQDPLISCQDCHLSRADRSQLLCATCHQVDETAEIHVEVPDFLHESGSCVLCHKNANPEGQLDHASFFPIGAGDTHGTLASPAISCADCHIDPETRTTLGCTTCHDLNDAVPAPKPHSEALLAATHQGVPGYVWDSPDCLFCHPDGSPEGAIDHSLYFPIGAGAAHEPIGCTECHTSPDDRLQVACATCHETTQEPPVSLLHTGIPEFAISSPACLACHPNAEPIGALDHEPFFPLQAPSVHQGNACSDCHVSQSQRDLLTCASCHTGEHDAQPMNALHLGMPGYLWDSPTCFGCHPRANNPGDLDHNAFFPIQVGQVHETISCAECHASQTDRAQLACTTCHEQAPTNTIHDAIPDYLFESSSCFLCHPGAEPIGVIQHDAFFPIETPAVHDAFTCRDCHINPASRQDVGCTGCHTGDHDQPLMATTHSGVPGYAWDSPACLTCHPNAEPVGFVDHTLLFPIAAGDAHAGRTCTECHLGDTTPQNLGCAQCHTTGGATPFDITVVHTGVPGYVPDSPTCLSCHPNAKNPGDIEHAPFFPITAPSTHSVVTCKECHASQADRSTLSCATCHERAVTTTQHSLVAGYVHDSPACLTCHPQGEAAGAINHAAFFPIEVGTTHAVFGCVDCHTNPNDVTVVGCADCHTGDHDAAPMAQVHGAVPGYTHDSPACLACHPSGEAIGLAGVDHDLYFPINDPAVHTPIGCAECHIDSGNLNQVGCYECHAAGVTNITGVHGNVPDVDGNTRTTECKLCHADSQVERMTAHDSQFRITGGAHQGERCLDCHVDELGPGQTAPIFRTDKPWATDFNAFTCIGCHEHDNEANRGAHQDENDFNNTSLDCLRCHPRGRK